MAKLYGEAVPGVNSRSHLPVHDHDHITTESAKGLVHYRSSCSTRTGERCDVAMLPAYRVRIVIFERVHCTGAMALRLDYPSHILQWIS
jgi:hypothetical protein